MCHFISGLILNDFELTDLNEIGTFYSITFAKCDNDFIKGQLDNNEIYLIKSSKYCDCGTELGALQRFDNPSNKRIEKSELDKLKKKGWTDSKIQRWIDDKNKINVRDQNKFDQFRTGIHSDIDNWISFIQDLYSKTKIKKFGLMLHWYKGGVNTERIKVLDKVKTKLKDLDDQILLRIKEDTMYYIER